MVEIDTRQLGRLRLLAQWLIASPADSVKGVVRNLLAIQAQDFGAAQWAIGTRLPGSTVHDVREALNKGQIVRSWPMRGTLHFVAAEDLQWMLGVTAERTLKSVAGRWGRLGLPESDLPKASKIAERLLSSGGQATRDELIAALHRGGIRTEGQIGYHFIWYLAHIGQVCWGPMSGNQQVLVSSREWLPPTTPFDRNHALGEYLRRYLAGHGPATLKDYAWWNKVTMADARRGLEAVRDSLTELACDGIPYWITTDTYERTIALLPTSGASVFALPGFDEHLLGYRDRDTSLPKAFVSRIVPGGNGVFLPTLVSDGIVRAVWRRTRTRSTNVVRVEPFDSLTPEERKAFSASIARYGDFWQEPTTIEWK